MVALKMCSECGESLTDWPSAITCSTNCRVARFRRLRREKEEFIARALDSLVIEPTHIDGVPHIRVSLENLTPDDRAGLELLAEADAMDASTWVVENIRETLQDHQAEIDRRRRRRKGE